MKTTNFLLFFYMLFLSSIYSGNISAAASETNNIDTHSIERQVEKFLRERITQRLPENQHSGVKIQIRNIDQRLRLSKCAKELTLTLQGQKIQRTSSVKVMCDDNTPWSIYVGSTISLELPVVALRSELPRRHIIRESDLMIMQRDIYSLRDGYTTHLDNIVGQELKRALRAGDVVYSFHLQAPDIVKKGDRVTLIAKRGGLSVMSHGIAMASASKGERVRVENQRSARIIQGKVIGPGTVEIL